MITGNLNVIPDARVRNIISKGPKYRLPSNIDFPKCRREVVASLDFFCSRIEFYVLPSPYLCFISF